MEFLTFHVGEREFAVDLARVREIVTPPPITRVPGMPPALLGLVGLRGDPTAVVDAGLRLDARAVARSARTPLIVLSVQQADRPVEIGLLVEAAGRKLDLETLLPWTDGLARFAGSDACTGFADVDGQLVLVLDVDTLLSFGRIAAAGVRALPGRDSSPPRTPSVAGEPLRAEPMRSEASSQILAAAPAPHPPAIPVDGAVAQPGPISPAPSVASTAPEQRAPRARPAAAALDGPRPLASNRAVSSKVPPRAAFAPAPSASAGVVAAPAPADAPLPRSWSAEAAVPSHAARAPLRAHAPEPEPEAEMELGLSRDRRTRLGWVAAAAAIALALLVALLQTTGSRREELAVAPRRGPTSSEVEPRGRDPRPTAYAPSVVVASQAERRIEPRPEPSPPPAPSQPPPAPHPTAVAARPAVAAPTPAQALARPARKLPEFMRVTPDTPACEIHDVKRGDTLWAISARRLGDPYRWPQVYGQNRDHLVDPNVIEIDDRIRIPGACQPAVVK